MNWNLVQLGGNLTRDPELKFTPGGRAVCEVGVAINRAWNDEAGNRKEEVTFVDATFFGKSAEAVAKHMRKGRAIFISGRLKLDTWEDKQTKQKKSRLRVVAEEFQFCDRRPDGTSNERPAAQDEGGAKREDDVPF